MQTPILIAAICGFAATLLNMAPLTGHALGFMVSMVAPMPIFLAGLMQGWVYTAIAGAIATGVTLAVAGEMAGLIFAVSVAVPAIVLVRQALLAQDDGTGTMVWYPVNRLAWWLVGLGAMIGVVLSMVLADGLLDQVLEPVIDMADPDGRIDAAGREALMTAMNRVAPAVVAASLVLTIVLNGAWAQRMAERMGRAVRPRMVFTDLQLPVSGAVALALCVLGSMLAPGEIGQVAVIGASMLGLLFVLQGFAVVHLKARNRANGVLMLGGTYLIVLFTMPVLGPIPLIFIMLLGIADSFMTIRPQTPGAGT